MSDDKTVVVTQLLSQNTSLESDDETIDSEDIISMLKNQRGILIKIIDTFLSFDKTNQPLDFEYIPNYKIESLRNSVSNLFPIIERSDFELRNILLQKVNDFYGLYIEKDSQIHTLQNELRKSKGMIEDLVHKVKNLEESKLGKTEGKIEELNLNLKKLKKDKLKREVELKNLEENFDEFSNLLKESSQTCLKCNKIIL